MWSIAKDARYVSFASAGTRGICYLGCLDALETHLGEAGFQEWRDQLRGAAGTSAGSCAALMLLLGLDRDARREVFEELSDFGQVVRFPDVALLLRQFGLEDGRTFKGVVQRVLNRGGLSETSTFADLRRLLRQDFVCVCTDLKTSKPVYLSAATTPHLRVCDGVYASSCVPFMFAPQTLDGTTVIDGCMSCELPRVFDEEQTLFVWVDKDEEVSPLTFDVDEPEHKKAVSSWVEFLQSIVRCSSEPQQAKAQQLLADRPHQVLHVYLPPDAMALPVMDLQHDSHSSEMLFHAGYVTTMDLLSERMLSAAAHAAVCIYLHLAMTRRVNTALFTDTAGASECDPENA